MFIDIVLECYGCMYLIKVLINYVVFEQVIFDGIVVVMVEVGIGVLVLDIVIYGIMLVMNVLIECWGVCMVLVMIEGFCDVIEMWIENCFE